MPFILHGLQTCQTQAGLCYRVEASIDDNELSQQFKEVEQMDDDDRSTVKKLIDTFIIKHKVQKLAQ